MIFLEVIIRVASGHHFAHDCADMFSFFLIVRSSVPRVHSVNAMRAFSSSAPAGIASCNPFHAYGEVSSHVFTPAERAGIEILSIICHGKKFAPIKHYAVKTVMAFPVFSGKIRQISADFAPNSSCVKAFDLGNAVFIGLHKNSSKTIFPCI